MNIICHSQRLALRQFNFNDSRFIIRLLNEEAFIRYIADKNVNIELNYQKNLPQIRIVKDQIHQVLVNILMNALWSIDLNNFV